MRTAKYDIFRSGHGETNKSSPVRTPSPPSHRSIFRRPKQNNYSPSANSGSSEESIMAALPHGPSWPPLTIPESESADTSKLGLSRPIQTGSSSVSRHNMELNASTSSEREPRRKPSYYTIKMRNGMAKLASGDDSSILSDDHNDRILLTPIQERKKRLIRASPITEASSSSSDSPGREGGHTQAWEVLGNGKIVAANPATPSSTSQGSSSRQRRIKTSTPTAPKKPFLRSRRTPATPTKGGDKSKDPESPPRLQKSSFDTISTDASSTDNSFYHEILDLAEPISPPRMDRVHCPSQVLFAEGSKESGELSSKNSKKSGKSQRSSRYTAFEPKKKDETCNASFFSQLFDLISLGPCCQMDSMCRDPMRTTTVG